MQKKGIDLIISQDPANMNYLTGYDAWSFYYAQCVLIHINEDEPICFLRHNGCWRWLYKNLFTK